MNSAYCARRSDCDCANRESRPHYPECNRDSQNRKRVTSRDTTRSWLM